MRHGEFQPGGDLAAYHEQILAACKDGSCLDCTPEEIHACQAELAFIEEYGWEEYERKISCRKS